VNHRHLIAAALLVGAVAPLSAQSVKAGIAAWQHSDYESAAKIWRPLAEKGDADAQFNLAQAYRLGRGVPINLAAAQSWLKRAAYQGHVDAETTLGLLMFQNGNRTLGVYWLKRAAAKNDPRAMLVYGTALYNGDGVKPDVALGYSYVSRAAAQGLAPAKDTLAQMEESLSPEQRSKGAALLADAKPPTKAVAPKSASAKPVRDKSPPVKVVASAPPRAAPGAKMAASGNWRIQLGAFSQRSSAEALFRKFSASSALAGRSPAYISAGPVIRLQVGPFESRTAAANACHAIAARGQACFPVPAK
jgi:TPR repeat protein